jgi:hypothetical protein
MKAPACEKGGLQTQSNSCKTRAVQEHSNRHHKIEEQLHLTHFNQKRHQYLVPSRSIPIFLRTPSSEACNSLLSYLSLLLSNANLFLRFSITILYSTALQWFSKFSHLALWEQLSANKPFKLLKYTFHWCSIWFRL